MPSIKSAKKRVKTSERNRIRNRDWKSRIRSEQSTIEGMLKSGSIKGIEKNLTNYYMLVDRAVSKGVLHGNTGARKKSRLAVRINQLKSGS